jgi:NAD(P)-dependent dehydrogenase (short-subunit alcohol dehydrogenase family)
MNTLVSLTDQVIAICGGTSGMGLAIARAVNEAGGTVVVLGREDDHAAAAREVLRGTVMTGEATYPAAAEALISTAWKTHGALHGLVHVAGGSGRAFGDGPLHEHAGPQFSLNCLVKPRGRALMAAARDRREHCEHGQCAGAVARA